MRIAGSALLCLLLAACASAQHPTQAGPVGLGLWCEEVTATLCHSTGERCQKGKANFEVGCQQAARESCLAGRDRSTSAGRSEDELRQCVKLIKGMDCAGLDGAGGALATSCAAKVASPAAGQP